MHTYKLLQSLFLLPALVASNVFADHKPSHNPNPPIGGEGGPLWVLMDSDDPPKPVVGVVSHATEISVYIKLPGLLEDYLASVWTYGFDNNALIYFVSSDCTGQAYIEDRNSYPFNFFAFTFIAQDEGDQNSARFYERVGFMEKGICSPYT